jgi:hypothetical protein
MDAHTTHDTAAEPQRWPERKEPSGGRALLIVGVILGFIGIWLLVVGGRAVWAVQGRDSEGIYTSDSEVVSTDSYALSSPPEFSGAGPDVLYARDLLGSVRISGSSPTGTELFIGIAPADDVAAYLDGVGHDEIRDIEVSPFAVEYESHAGGPPEGAPTAQTFWSESVSGTGTQTLDTEIPAGDWSVVVMHADGSAGVTADLQVGATLPIITWIAFGALAAGGPLLLIGIILAALGMRRR